MITKEEHEKIGTTRQGLGIYRSRENGIVSVEQDSMYLVLPSAEELGDIEQLLLDESCRDMDIWIPSGEMHNDGRIVYILRKTGKRAVLDENDRLEMIEKPMFIGNCIELERPPK